MTHDFLQKFYWIERPVLPFREDRILDILAKTIILLHLQIFKEKKLHRFQNLSLRFIFTIFLKFRKYQPDYSYQVDSFNKERVQFIGLR